MSGATRSPDELPAALVSVMDKDPPAAWALPPWARSLAFMAAAGRGHHHDRAAIAAQFLFHAPQGAERPRAAIPIRHRAPRARHVDQRTRLRIQRPGVQRDRAARQDLALGQAHDRVVEDLRHPGQQQLGPVGQRQGVFLARMFSVPAGA